MAPSAPVRRCIFCHGPFPSNDAVEHFPVGKRVAFDPHRGRLWAVCPSCRRWNLAPFEDRWEALEELEKAGRDRGRVLASTENIALIQVPGVEVVRVGSARLAEEAWWRYGSQMMQRRSRYQGIAWAEQAALIAAFAATGGTFLLLGMSGGLNDFLRWRKFGRVAWRGAGVVCDGCGRPLREVKFAHTGRCRLDHDEAGSPLLVLRCQRCYYMGHHGRPGEFRIEGLPARHLLRRAVTYHHYAGASEKRVRSATDYIDQVGSPGAVLAEVSRGRPKLEDLLGKRRRTHAVALEIALNEESERRLLEMELAELEARWREEEEIAAIVDGELTPVPAASSSHSPRSRPAPAPPGP